MAAVGAQLLEIIDRVPYPVYTLLIMVLVLSYLTTRIEEKQRLRQRRRTPRRRRQREQRAQRAQREQREAAASAIMLLYQVSSVRRQCSGGASASEEDCPVCCQTMEADEVCCVLPTCGHEYHSLCLLRWFNQRKSTCPMCMAKVQCDESQMTPAMCAQLLQAGQID